MSFIYPEVSDETFHALKIILEQAEQDPDYLQESPYPNFLKSLIPNPQPSVKNQPVLPQNRYEDLYENLSESLQNIKRLQSEIHLLPLDKQAQVFNATSNIITKMSELLNKLEDSMHIEQFRAIMFTAIEEYLSAEQKQELITKLKRIA